MLCCVCFPFHDIFTFKCFRRLCSPPNLTSRLGCLNNILWTCSSTYAHTRTLLCSRVMEEPACIRFSLLRRKTRYTTPPLMRREGQVSSVGQQTVSYYWWQGCKVTKYFCYFHFMRLSASTMIHFNSNMLLYSITFITPASSCYFYWRVLLTKHTINS